jgi:hypothetical protein
VLQDKESDPIGIIMAANQSYSFVILVILIAIFGAIIIYLLTSIGITSKLLGGMPVINTIISAILVLTGKKVG